MPFESSVAVLFYGSGVIEICIFVCAYLVVAFLNDM